MIADSNARFLVLATLDGSACDTRVAEAAAEITQRFPKGELHLLHVLSEILPAGPDPLLMPVMPAQFYKENEDRARETLSGLLKADWGKPPRVAQEVRWGSPVESIVAYSIEQSIDMIVIATHGRTGLSHVFLGSVAERIVREAPCPVLTIRDRQAAHHPRPAQKS